MILRTLTIGLLARRSTMPASLQRMLLHRTCGIPSPLESTSQDLFFGNSHVTTNRTFMSSIYSSGTDEVAEHFGVSTTVSLLGLSLYSLGLSFGPVLAAPLSETFGRSIIYRVTLPVSAIFTIGSAVAQNMATIVVCRFFAGFFAAPALSIGGGTTADIFKPSSRGIAMSFFLLAPCLGPAVGW